jgi:hypothetical protein
LRRQFVGYSTAATDRGMVNGRECKPFVMVLLWIQTPQGWKMATDIQRAEEQAGDPVRLVSIPDVGHFEIASPLATTWPAVRSEIVALLAKQP